MNFQEIKEVLEKHYDSVEEFAYDSSDAEVPGVGKFVIVKKYGGEGKGEEWYNTRHFIDHDVYISVAGYYTSYDGVYFEDGWYNIFEVRPKEKTVIVYEPGTK
jgi:hypothetical protein